MIVIPGKTFLPGPEEVSEPEASPDSAADPLETAAAGGPAAPVVPFDPVDPGAFPDASRFGSGETAKRPCASPGGAESAGSATAGIGVSARKVRKSGPFTGTDRKSTRLNSSHEWISYAVFCLKKKTERGHKEARS